MAGGGLLIGLGASKEDAPKSKPMRGGSERISAASAVLKAIAAHDAEALADALDRCHMAYEDGEEEPDVEVEED